MTESRVIRGAASGWEGVEPAPYKDEGGGPGCFLGATRHTLLGAAHDGPGAALDFEVRYFELARAPHETHRFRANGAEALGFLCIVDRERDRPVLVDEATEGATP